MRAWDHALSRRVRGVPVGALLCDVTEPHRHPRAHRRDRPAGDAVVARIAPDRDLHAWRQDRNDVARPCACASRSRPAVARPVAGGTTSPRLVLGVDPRPDQVEGPDEPRSTTRLAPPPASARRRRSGRRCVVTAHRLPGPRRSVCLRRVADRRAPQVAGAARARRRAGLTGLLVAPPTAGLVGRSGHGHVDRRVGRGCRCRLVQYLVAGRTRHAARRGATPMSGCSDGISSCWW